MREASSLWEVKEANKKKWEKITKRHQFVFLYLVRRRPRRVLNNNMITNNKKEKTQLKVKKAMTCSLNLNTQNIRSLFIYPPLPWLLQRGRLRDDYASSVARV